MPDINRIYYQQTQDEAGNQWLLQIIPAGSTLLSTPTYIEITSEVVFDLSSIKFGYDGKPRGHIETPSMAVKFDLEEMEHSTEMQDLRTAIQQPIASAAGTLDLGESETVTFDTSNRFVIMCDRGAGYDPPGAGGSTTDPCDSRFYDAVIFEGTQRVLPKRHYELDAIAATEEDEAEPIVELDINLVHMARAVLEAVRTEWLCIRIFNSVDRVNETLYNDVFPLLWRTTDPESRIWGRVTRGEYVAAYRQFDLFDQLRILADAVYRTWCRDDSVTFRFISGPYDDQNAYGTPFDHITLKKLNYLADGNPGSTLNVGDRLFIGATYLSSSGGSLDEAIGGLLADTGERTTCIRRAWGNCWDTVAAIILSHGCKMQLPSTTAGTLRVWFSKVKQNTQAGARTIAMGNANPKLGIDEPGQIIAGVDVAIPGMEGRDESQYKSQTTWRGTETENRDNIPATWHTSPRYGDEASQSLVYKMYSTEVGQQVYGIEDDCCFLVGLAPHSPWQVLYIERPHDGAAYLTTDPVIIGAHAQCEIDYGGTVPVFSGGPIALPFFTLESGDPILLTPETEQWLALLELSLRDMQMDMGLPQTVAEMFSLLFGHPSQVEYTGLELLLSVIQPAWLGEVFTLGDGTANTFLGAGKTYLGHLSTVAELTAIEITKPAGTAICSFLHVESPY